MRVVVGSALRLPLTIAKLAIEAEATATVKSAPNAIRFALFENFPGWRGSWLLEGTAISLLVEVCTTADLTMSGSDSGKLSPRSCSQSPDPSSFSGALSVARGSSILQLSASRGAVKPGVRRVFACAAAINAASDVTLGAVPSSPDGGGSAVVMLPCSDLH